MKIKLQNPICKEAEDGIHEWMENEDFSSGMITLISGSPKDLGEETQLMCMKCGAVEYVRVRDLGSIVDLLK